MSSCIRVLELRCADGPGGGPEKTIIHGAAIADPTRLAVTVCYIRGKDDGDTTIRQRAEESRIDYHEVHQRHPLDMAVYRAVRQLCRSRAIDIVHAHDYKTDLFALMLARRVGVIPLATSHGWTGHSRRERWLYYPADKKILARFPLVLAVSSEIRNVLIRCGATPDRIRVLLNGIDHTRFRRDCDNVQKSRQRWEIPSDAFVIGSVGRLEPQKRFDLLIEAFAKTRGIHPRTTLLIAGAGSERDAWETLATKLGLGGACQFVGHCEPISDFYHALDLFVQSSDYEGTPNVVLEAMALEVPVVATSVGGTAELIQDGIDGWLVPPRDATRLASAITEAIGQNTVRTDRARQARRRVETHLSFERRCRSLQAIYNELGEIRGRSFNRYGVAML